MSDIEVQNITKKFGDFTAVDNVSFSVEHSEIFGLLGPNGAGKSTLIRMLTTLIPTTSGSARICGHDVVTEADAVRHVIGVIPQAMTSDLELSVEENLLIYAKLYGVPREKRRRLMSELIEAVELTKWKDKPVKNLSGGMRRRVEIARGLVHEPRVFFSMNQRPDWTLSREWLSGKCSSNSNNSGTSPCFSQPTTWTKPTSSVIASPLPITESSWRWTRR